MASIHRVRAVGMDHDTFQFCVSSASRDQEGLEHEVHIDRRAGWMHCTCEDSLCRHKMGHILKDCYPRCRHMRAVIHQYEGILN